MTPEQIDSIDELLRHGGYWTPETQDACITLLAEVRRLHGLEEDVKDALRRDDFDILQQYYDVQMYRAVLEAMKEKDES